MKRRGFIAVFFLCFAFLLPMSAKAQDYQPGTLGYYVQNCREVLANANDLAEVYKSSCGAFAEGYYSGVMIAAGQELKSPPPMHDGCDKVRAEEYQNLNHAICPNLPIPKGADFFSPALLKTPALMLEDWLSYKKAQGDSAPMSRPIEDVLNELVRPGSFCDHLAHFDASRPYPLSPALSQMNKGQILSFVRTLQKEDKTKRCEMDTGRFGGAPQMFPATRCGSEILGFMTGVQALSYLQPDYKDMPAACRKEIKRLYKSYDPRETMCLRPDTDPFKVALLYTGNAKMIKTASGRGNGWLDFDLYRAGELGYEVIYKGFLCRAQQQRNN